MFLPTLFDESCTQYHLTEFVSFAKFHLKLDLCFPCLELLYSIYHSLRLSQLLGLPAAASIVQSENEDRWAGGEWPGNAHGRAR
jgi:hypothetical protein